ncbi:DUF4062 domain-containing protein [Solirubrobacter ginsenosidimutans]|uniref:DUF4062 domain-containing protein n=1 Tax=Solirubrobacter ginsenosidimutans TaxID=490573 RepID=A0A9X3S498_9ACTN|nr:DUF4062 domain-containing protein [Solirubrobacter ginsenosidimutans]MDA0162916.1 DUF4062 domain-containing protein [Solirubrobacter ginsenosidimutans]
MDATRWQRVGLFISSTFDDMHAERDYLVKRVLPELQEWCEERRLRLVDIDLRWGVVEPDMTGIVRKCLAAIDASQPLFLCLLGQRRGTIVERGATVTELELAHALAGPCHVLAYLRDPSPRLPALYTTAFDPEAAHERTRAWARAEAEVTRRYSAVWDPDATTPELRLPGASEESNAERCRGRLTQFACDARPLAEPLLEDLRAAILADHPDRASGFSPGRLERELGQQEQVLAAAAEATVVREATFAALDAYADGADDTLFALTGPSGIGKTTALAGWVRRRRAAGELVRCRSVGASDGSTAVETVLQSLLEEVGATPQEPLRDTWLDALAGETVVLDGLDQLDAGLDDLDWLPWTLPEGVRLIVSFAGPGALGERMVAGGDVIVHEVAPFEDPATRRRLVVDYLAGYLKELAPELVEELIAFPAASNPLYLKVVLSELRVFGPHASLKEELDARFGEDAVSAFDAVLARIERDAGGEAAPDVFGLLACARAGLSAPEIAGALGDPALADEVHGLLRQVRAFTARRAGRYDFLHASFADAARARYVTPERQAALAAYFDALPLWSGGVPNARKVAELPFHLGAAGQTARAAEVLSDLRFIEAKCAAGMTSALLADYAAVEAAPFAAFVRQESHALSRYATTRGFTLQHAYNWRRAGPVREAAERALGDGEPPLWLRRLDPPADGGPELATLEGHDGGVTDVAFAGSDLLSAGLDGTVIAWNTATWRRRERVVRVDSGINSCAAYGDLVAVGCEDGSVRVHDRARNATVMCEGVFEHSARRCRFLPDGRLLSVGRFGLRIHDPRSGELLHTFHGDETIQDCDPEVGGLIALACSDADVNLYDPVAGELVASLGLPRGEGQAWGCRRSPDGSLLLAGGGKFQYSDDVGPFGECVVWDTRTHEVVHKHRFRVMVSAVAFSPDGASYVVGLLDGSLELFDTRTGDRLASVDAHAKTVRSLQLSPTGEVLASASLDGRVRAWDAAALARATEAAPGNGLFCAIASDGRTASVWSGTPNGFDYAFRQRDYDLVTATKVRDEPLYLDGEASHIAMFRLDPMTLLTGVRISADAAGPPHATAPVAGAGDYWLLASSARMFPFDLSLAPALPEALRSRQNVRWARARDGRYALLEQPGALVVGAHTVLLPGDAMPPHLPQVAFDGERVLCISGNALCAVSGGVCTVLHEGAGPLAAFCASGDRVAVAGEDGVHVLGEGRIHAAPSLDCAFADDVVVSLGTDGVLRVGDAVFVGATALTAFAVAGRTLVATDTGGTVYLLALSTP